MKLFKKVLSVATVTAFVVAVFPLNAKAATNVIDFEDGAVPASLHMALQADGTTPDGDPSLLSVVDFNGSKALFIDTQQSLQPKLVIDVAQLVGADSVSKVRGISLDLTIVNPDGDAPGWNGGSYGANYGADGSLWYDPADWSLEGYDGPSTDTKTLTDTWVDGMGFTDNGTGNKYMLLKWDDGSDAAKNSDLYVDNITLYDADGNAVALDLGTVEEAAPADTATDAAPAADVPKTGVVGFGIVYGLGALATGAVALKRKSK